MTSFLLTVRCVVSQGIRLESFSKCDFIPVDYDDARRVKASFKKLVRACAPSSPFVDPEKGFLRAFEDSEWHKQLQCIVQIAGAIVDLLDMQGSSVMLCLEDGWDFTAQVTTYGISLCSLCPQAYSSCGRAVTIFSCMTPWLTNWSVVIDNRSTTTGMRL